MALKKIPGGACRTAALSILALLIGASCGGEKEVSTMEERKPVAFVDREYLNRAGAEWDSLFNAGDLTGLMNLYSQQAVSMPFNAPTMQGIPAVRAGWEKFLTDYQAEHVTSVDEVLVADDWAVERAHYLLTYSSRTSGNVTVEAGRNVVCRKKTDGRWQIVWEIRNTSKAPVQQTEDLQ
ncbi:MAG: DUF4440 domain-containing protein [candidate division Zixibacteria bacterium]|nr:DUF4440 domain-containing protein [candidate division Zixibacteria bacterium]